MVIGKPRGKILLQTEILRQKGMLYYCGTDKDGYIVLCEAPMKYGGTKKK